MKSMESTARLTSGLSLEDAADAVQKHKDRRRKIIIASIVCAAVTLVVAGIAAAVVFFLSQGPISYTVPKEWQLVGDETTGESVPKLWSNMKWLNLAWCPTKTYGGYKVPNWSSSACQEINITKKEAEYFDIVNVDLFLVDEATIRKYRSWGKIVSCYFSAGTVEPFREDVAANKRAWRAVEGNEMPKWDEQWLNLNYLDSNEDDNGPGIKELMKYRLALAAKKGCQFVEPDNVDCWANDCGRYPGQGSCTPCYAGMPKFNENDTTTWGAYNLQLEYLNWLSEEAHARGLGIGMKNNFVQVKTQASLADKFDFSAAERCYQWEECGMLKPFVDAHKPIFAHEYALAPTGYLAEDDNTVVVDPEPWAKLCSTAKKQSISLQGPSCLGKECAETVSKVPVWSYCDDSSPQLARTPEL